ncbi:hypothetical protein K7A41_19830 [Sphingobacterium sp. InxBP1]|uniref:hypothetical protein n=1 Tax=Sphingobacterium sp. InxBP1 TaxID=2870328 RepID=UPI0022437752|nr:hypothetical protein [Sphingobacterium sp. InxBP1]MCW8313487.1 hypothetical protein [Sphingobacterium sp. InxBP1]
MKSKLSLGAIQRSLLLRMGITLAIMLIGLTLINVAKIDRFTPLTYGVYVLPHVAYFCLLYVGYSYAVGRNSYAWLAWLLMFIAVLSAYTAVKYYYYELVTQFIDGFSAPWRPEHRPVLMAKIIGGLLFFALILAADYLVWEWYVIRIQFKNTQVQLRNLSDVQLLSGHFLRRLYHMLDGKPKAIQASSLRFFQYISDKITHPQVLVPLREEWSYLKSLISYCHQRKFVVQGEELLDRQLLNRSLPTLSIMTWIENAVAYSPADPSEFILLRWTKLNHGIQLLVRNRIAAVDIEKGTGKGLELVNRLFETMKNQRIELEYVIENRQYFLVKLTFIY